MPPCAVGAGFVRAFAQRAALVPTLLLVCACTAVADVPLLPVLARTQRSDWVNVRDLGARGDGVSDDTAALQAGLDAISMHDARNRTLYFPAGVFVITRGLFQNFTTGTALMGEGRGSVLRWGGPVDATARMLWSSGNTRAIVEGLVFDGAGRAGVGYDHDTHWNAGYETRMVHRHLAFLNFLTAGVRVGWDSSNANVASAEMTFTNCVFAHSAAGLALLAFNDYDNYVTGCLFTGCGVGIDNAHGMAYVSNTRFERSSVCDSRVSGQPNSFRRVVSVGSAQFLTQSAGGAGSPTKVHSSFVAGWGVAGGAALDAIAFNETRGPYQVVDTVFASPVDARSCAVGLSPAGGGALSPVLLSNVSTLPAGGCVLNPASAANARVYAVPPGAASALLPSLTPATTFFRSGWPPEPSAVYDAVRDFGADATGRADAAPALQACVRAAAAGPEGAECYVPAGLLSLNATVFLCGAGFSLGGSGWASQLQAAPGFAAPLLAAGPGAGCNASRFQLRRIKTLTSRGASEQLAPDFVLSRTAAVPASRSGKFLAFSLPGGGNESAAVDVTLDSSNLMSTAGYVLNGLVLGDSVTGGTWDGNPSVMDCGDALLFSSFLALGYGFAELARPSTRHAPAQGFFGAAMMASASNTPFDLGVFDSASLVAQDFYSESPHGNLHLTGSADDAPGRVVVSALKANTNVGWPALVLDGYSGVFFHTGANVHYAPWEIRISGVAPVRVVLLGSALWTPAVNLTNTNPSAEVSFVSNIVANNTSPDGWLPDELHGDTLALVARGFDALRELGWWDLRINFPGDINGG